MSQLRATKPGLLVCIAICIFIFLYLRSPAPEEAEEVPASPGAVECGFYPDELCSALFQGKEAAPQIAKFCKNPQTGILAYLHTPGNCSRISQGLHFITRPLSAEEGNFSLAYIITIHKELTMFVQLLRAIYVPQNVYCIHVDEKAPKKYKSVVQRLVDCFENIFISKRQKVVHAGLTRLQADINCMKELVHSKFQWNYVINLCGQDFPIKTNKEIIHYIRSKWNDKNITPGVIHPPNIKSKASQSHPEPSPEGNVSPNKRFKHEPPHNLTMYFGSAYYILTRKFVQFILTDARAKDMLQWSKDIHSPEQHYWVTLNRLKDAPGATPDAGWEGNIRATKRRTEEGSIHDGCRGHYVQDTCVYGLGDLPWIIKSPSLFANQFEPSTDPLVVTCLERRHRLQALRQAEVPVEPHWRFQQETCFNKKLTQ
ncbi:Beta-1,3-galactosyl-O-glycosyl-glycoprotein beta-1,6-N-acetylglucosaminyltransferase 7 [Sciurus carolinensis]|uniref:Beta-1,3-galactosyl-O-glycosyl-glycoprotein beta-1,6-N-acetylglucosaminyltransferase 7 n=1 Tax=Sciurus carolinensis TaxID=30640 RepID=A0AA41MM53_SCICA|nr:beta-1,3-galactosyl-O-glycosyl-glycoprotein beta-1,6-N-acetylglucosaminyltransferase 7-like [Sciurus carolinensis]MBZ3874475.1 Beta-1,3-galactosyl-O-glycosyl-glycoprotein beta-1,6-N-acetylglucosaminyltransferase 7 [Sciurus carolinensis]